MNLNSKRKTFIFFCIFFLVLGVLLYFLFNPGIIAFKRIPFFFSEPVIKIKQTPFKQVLVGNAADFFWSISFSFGVQAILMLKGKQIVLLLCTSLLGLFVEILQYTHVMFGVFDPCDIIAYFFGSCFSIIIIGVINYEGT